jgi:hypothetical protein
MSGYLIKRLREPIIHTVQIKELVEILRHDAASRIEELEKQNGKLKEMFRVHMLRLMTNLTHEDIDNHIEEALQDD